MDDHPLAWAKLWNENICHYIVENVVTTIGRQISSGSKNHLSLGMNRNISRIHAKIYFDRHLNKFVFECTGKNGAMIDGQYIGNNYSPLPLINHSLIQISYHLFYFLLPKTSESIPVISQNKKNVSKIPFPNQFEYEWTNNSFQLFLSSIMSFGYGRWEMILKTLKDVKSIEEIKYFTIIFLYKISFISNNELNSIIQDLLLSSGAYYYIQIPSIKLLDEMKLEEEDIIKISRRLLLLRELSFIIKRFSIEKIKFFLSSVSVSSFNNLYSWWNASNDYALLENAYNNGFENYENIEMFRNQHLQFPNKQELLDRLELLIVTLSPMSRPVLEDDL